MDTAMLFSILRERDVKLWVDEDRLRCSAPLGALDVELRAALASQKTDILAFLRRAQEKSGPSTVVPIKPGGARTPIFAVSGHGGDVFYLLGMARHLDAEQPMLCVQPPGLDGTEPLTTVEALARYEVEQIRRYQANGPYLIAGHCAGGTIAFEVAQQLTAAGQRVALLALIGSAFPTMFQRRTLAWLGLRQRFRRYTKALSSASEFMKKLRRRMRSSHALATVSPAVAAARRRVESASVAAVRNYQPRPYSGRIDLFVTADKWHEAHRWRPFGGSVHEHLIGDFEIDDLLLGPDVAVLADLLQDTLRMPSIANLSHYSESRSNSGRTVSSIPRAVRRRL
jgi:thioesterase domain-containing protein